jgi:type I restriction-modification system DNA methylase subunit
MLIKGQDVEDIVFGDTLAADGYEGNTFNFCLPNPPFGADWKSDDGRLRDILIRGGLQERLRGDCTFNGVTLIQEVPDER